MNYKQSMQIEELYKRFKKLSCEKTLLFFDTERKLYNTDLSYKLEEDIKLFIKQIEFNINLLDNEIKPNCTILNSNLTIKEEVYLKWKNLNF